ncbi:lactonase family protein [Calycomorphotria hydatis]|uniref:6-phosphogluconolactonase n=1 Tax=Calycomorphotria hydatis TaxID=2528027 RepID=A0A517TEG4_9PLAN|nr:lactonase family protein [Calycomorphotria hydatis]QDT66759.1 6-phosphogluconolactonase [Calycomorphotria hydatis]
MTKDFQSRVTAIVWCLLGLFLFPFAGETVAVAGDHLELYVSGTGKSQEGPGIYRCQVDCETGEISEPKLALTIPGSNFFVFSPEQDFLYALGRPEGKNRNQSSQLYAAAVDKQGNLSLLNSASTGDSGACFVSLDGNGKSALVAHYGGGSVASLRIASDGSIERLVSLIEHEGEGPNKKRQTAPHPHSIRIDPTQQFAFAPDLGNDRIYAYRLDAGTSELSPHEPAWCSVTPGNGPRHLRFHPNGRYLYVTDELPVTVSAYEYDSASGTLTHLQTLPSLTNDDAGRMTNAEVNVHPSGKFVYVSNRFFDQEQEELNSIAVFSVDEETGKLTFVEREPTGGMIPRHFNLDADSGLMVVGNQSGNTLTSFKIDSETGALSPTGSKIALDGPICLQVLSQSK